MSERVRVRVLSRQHPLLGGERGLAYGPGRIGGMDPFRPRGRSMGKVRLLLGLVIAAFSLISYLGSKEYNAVTGEEQHIGIARHQEVALGQQSAPQLVAQFGGLHPDSQLQAFVDQVGSRVVERSRAAQAEWEYDFHLLADDETVNAFALPGGQVFITAALFERLETEGQLAGVLGHEIGHVIARHSTQRIAKENLRQGITLAVVLGTGVDPRTADIAGQLISMKYGREDELESDVLGVDFMSDAGYDPRSMMGVMEILASAGGGERPPEFMSTHPNPENRIGQIQAAIEAKFPQGVPAGLEP